MSDEERAYNDSEIDDSASDEDTINIDMQDRKRDEPFQVMVDHTQHINQEEQTSTYNKQSNLCRMTKYEYARLKGIRIEQLQRGSIPFVPYTTSDTAKTLFHKEFITGMLPFKIERKLPDGYSIYVRIRDFTHRDAAEYD